MYNLILSIYTSSVNSLSASVFNTIVVTGSGKSCHLHTRIIFRDMYNSIIKWIISQECMELLLHNSPLPQSYQKYFSLLTLQWVAITELPAIFDGFHQYHKCLCKDNWLGVLGSYGSGEKKHMRKLDHQMSSNEVLLCLKHHKN